MAITDKLKLTRDQFAKVFNNDHDTIRQFERLFEYVNTFVIPDPPINESNCFIEREVVTISIPSTPSNTVITHPNVSGTLDELEIKLLWNDGTNYWEIIKDIDVGGTSRGYSFNDDSLVGSISQFNLRSMSGVWTYTNASGSLATAVGGNFALTITKLTILT